ncbi:hypothetical protein TWF106_004143 [Orbilia oligospora]|uniref:YTH domain-containing protein n=1 Tax=Orbilia oligospora TaxID=2813651 RepID=A0A6G1M968_ORBOL|nr:hypothetical protein TWF788_006568 [Orbilia oligospora]KAF3181064.1 hypothetical protein TWF788_006568 [Orbilia oligospora]KAF3216911.1 hypothetical protein TWF679_002744 [Orbilia oligospora]KAF3216912.1 hypothetical protein TWF679_002744 [Orbilia oligospora]KAF3223880.1 hypothetical protein TWF191_006295 [Orbilia oligospora]
MGDAHPRSHRRSLIVSSTLATDIKHNIEDQEPSAGLNPISPITSDSITTTSANSPTMYGPTITMLPQAQQYHQSHMPYVAQAAQPRYPQVPMQASPPHQPFNMQGLQTSLQSYQLQGHQHGQQIRYAPVISPPSVQYNISPAPMQIPTVATQAGPMHSIPHYPQAPSYYDPYGQSPPGASHNIPIAGYNPTFSAPQPAGTEAPVQYPQWPHGSMPFIYLPQYGQQTGMIPPVAPLDYNYGQPQPGYIPRRRSAPHVGQETHDFQFASQPFDPAALGQRHGPVPRHLTQSTSRQRRGSPVSYSNSRVAPGLSQSLSACSNSSLGSRSSISTLHPVLLRGPPRKPRQSGHALWVGNLPPGTTVTALKDYFATTLIESVFLISKSNCAFVNYKTETACTEAMQKFHDSRFQGVRLVCRLRRNSSPGDVELDGNAEISIPAPIQESSDSPSEVEPEVASQVDDLSKPGEVAGKKGKDRYFIVKSLTLEDLDTSVSNGIWATQTHNEVALNEAYLASENVFLIFSANKSGEYYGYARMVSEISDVVASKIEWAPMTQNIDETALPKAIYTPPTATAPRGRIIDDSSRGTIFWEVIEDSDSEDESAPVEGTTISKAWGKPFRVEWVSTSKVPFYRTRGLRNPYNVSREVKIARDGTELEPTVGRKLIQMFHRGGAVPFDSDTTNAVAENSEAPAEVSQATEH